MYRIENHSILSNAFMSIQSLSLLLKANPKKAFFPRAHLVPMTVVVGRDVDTVPVVRNNHRVLAGVRLAAGGGDQLTMRENLIRGTTLSL